ncbi:MAG: DinB family protein [Planctomycetes bacterium]|nr:DinB family protein [Planctomycetota bacterium]
MVDPEQLAERYLNAVDAFAEALRAIPADRMDLRETPASWSPRDIAFHVADVDQLLGLRLRRILGDEHPDIAGINTHSNVEQFRRIRADRSLALDALAGSSALNAATVEVLQPAQLTRKGRHPHGHDVTAGDVAMFLSLHIEAHVKQLTRLS